MAKQQALVVCTTCRIPGRDPAEVSDGIRDGAKLSAALRARGIAHDTQECFSACAKGCVIALRGAQRWTYVQGALDPELDLDALITMTQAYQASEDGIVPWRSRPEVIRKNTIARIPPFEV